MATWFEGNDKETHNRLIDQIINSPFTPLDHAARNEILALRAEIAKLKKAAPKTTAKTTRTRKAKTE